MGEKLSNSWSEDGYVDVTFTGAPIQEMTEASDKVEIVAVDDTSKTQLTQKRQKRLEARRAEAGKRKRAERRGCGCRRSWIQGRALYDLCGDGIEWCYGSFY